MPKRFTETDKWKDKWFRSLKPEFKCAWQYLCDNCDAAGVIDVDFELANFQIGTAVDWQSFIEHCGSRLEVLSNGKFWIPRFVEFQYQVLSDDCPAHKPVFQSLEKYDLLDRVRIPLAKGTGKGKGKREGQGEGNGQGQWVVPERLDNLKVRSLLEKFAAMRRKIKKPIRDLENTSIALEKFDDAEHLIYALEFCIANEYQGLKPDYRPSPKQTKTEQQPFELGMTKV